MNSFESNKNNTNNKNYAMLSHEKQAMLRTLENIQVKLNDAAGSAVAVELRMRLLAELSEDVRNNLKSSKSYIECNLADLEKAIIETYNDKLSEQEKISLKDFKELRNKLLHGDFVALMVNLNITPHGREIDKDGNRNILPLTNIKEAIISIDNSSGFSRFSSLAKSVMVILDRLIGL